MKPRLHLVAILLLAAVSGAAALVYQVVWFRELRSIFGLSTSAQAAVLAVFLGGLGAGAAWLGRRADRHPRPLFLYGNLELLVALTAAASPWLLRLGRELYLLTGGQASLGIAAATGVRWLVAIAVLAAPTFLLGGTLPALVRALETEADRERRRTALAYGVNTLGGVVGVCLATFLLVEWLGQRQSLLVAACASALVGVGARRLARRLPATSRGEEAPAPGPEPGGRGAFAPAASAPPMIVLAAAAVIGFVFLFLELVWYRMLAPILGGTTFTFGVILAVALLGIALGGGIYALRPGRRPVTLQLFAATLGLEGLAIAAPLVLGDRLALLAAFSRDFSGLGFGGSLLSWTLVTAVVVLPTATIAGYQFPLLVALLGEGRAAVGRHVGVAYALNTVGSIAGAALGGFVLIPSLGAVACWRLAAGLCLLLSLAALVVYARATLGSVGHRGSRWVAVGAVVLGGLALLAPGPTAAWRHGGIGAGRAQLDGEDPNAVRRFLHEARRSLVWEADGRESGVGLEAATAYAFVVNGKVDGNAIHDAGTQIMSGLLGALLHPEPRSALVIGLGTGSTAGWLADVPSMERVEVIELEPVVERVARACAPVNRDVLGHPKVRVVHGDAREVVLTDDRLWDIVMSEPSNPYRAGVAGLFTRDFYLEVRERLAEDGLFLQWFQGYEVDTPSVGVVLNTLGSVFPEVQVWRTMPSDLLLVASTREVQLDLDLLARRVASEPFASALARAWHTGGVEGVLARHLADPTLVDTLRGAGLAVSTDDRNQLEFMVARSVGQEGRFRVETLLESARRRGAERPQLGPDSSPPNWQRVERERVGAFLEEPAAGDVMLGELLRFHRAWREGRSQDALEAWDEAGVEAVTDLERLGLARARSRLGDLAAEQPLAELEGRYPFEVSALRGRLWLERGELDAAWQALRDAVGLLQSEPWGEETVFQDLFAAFEALGQQSGPHRRRAFELLAEPFAVERGRDRRLQLRLRLAAGLDDDAFAVALAELGRWVPWDPWVLEQRALHLLRREDPAARRALEDRVRYARSAPLPFDALVDPLGGLRPRSDPAGPGSP